LGRYNNTDDVVFGSVVSGRNPEVQGVEKIVGLFINTIPVRISYGDNPSFSELLLRVQKTWLDSEKYSACSLAKIRSQNGKEKLIDHVIAFEKLPVRPDG